ncbi:MAG: hypothetical protein IJ525_00165 [Alphaproteobacteria bacterium]|nr:hypothetical protein [Alphaproteobacteria bacterium]
MRNLDIKNIKSHPSLSLAKANASRDLQINFNQAEDALTIPAESRHDYECGSATQSGRSMIEMLGVLAIIGVLSVGGIAGYSKAMMKYRINKTIEQITLIAGNIRSFFAPQRSYAGISEAVIKKAKLVPDEMVLSNKLDGQYYLSHPFGDVVDIKATCKTYKYHDCEDNNAFTIKLKGLPIEACIELLTYDWNSAGMQGIDIGAYNTSSPQSYGFKIPADVSIAVEKCSSIYTGDNYHGVGTDEFTLYFDIDITSEMYASMFN